MRMSLIRIGLKYYGRHPDDLADDTRDRLIEILAWEQVSAEEQV